VALPTFPFVVLDTETTGVLPKVDRILEIAVVRYENGREVRRVHSLLVSPVEIPKVIRVLTRINPQALLSQPTLPHLWAEITPLLTDAVIVGHNINFDIAMLRAEGCDLGESPLTLDTALLASLAFPEFKSSALAALALELALPHDPPHRALGDVLATAALLDRISERLVKLSPAQRHSLTAPLEHGPAAYRLLFSSLPQGRGDATWLQAKRRRRSTRAAPRRQSVAAPTQQSLFSPKGVSEEPPESGHGSQILELPLGSAPWAVLDLLPPTSLGQRNWLAVRNLELTLSRTPPPEGVAILRSPAALIDPAAWRHLLAKDRLSAEELLLALRASLLPTTIRAEVRLFGDQSATVSGLLAASPASPIYQSQFVKEARTVLLDHTHLLALLSETHARSDANLGPRAEDRIVIADASILEDAITKALGQHIVTDHLRAAGAFTPSRVSDTPAPRRVAGRSRCRRMSNSRGGVGVAKLSRATRWRAVGAARFGPAAGEYLAHHVLLLSAPVNAGWWA